MKDVTTILCHLSTVPEQILMLISLFGHILTVVIKVQIAPFIFIYLIIYNLRKYHSCKMISENHEITPLHHLFLTFKGYLDKIVHFMVKEKHRLHNSVAELEIAKLTPRFFQYLITSPLMITALRYLTLCNFINRSFNTYQTQSIHI